MSSSSETEKELCDELSSSLNEAHYQINKYISIIYNAYLSFDYGNMFESSISLYKKIIKNIDELLKKFDDTTSNRSIYKTNDYDTIHIRELYEISLEISFIFNDLIKKADNLKKIKDDENYENIFEKIRKMFNNVEKLKNDLNEDLENKCYDDFDNEGLLETEQQFMEDKDLSYDNIECEDDVDYGDC